MLKIAVCDDHKTVTNFIAEAIDDYNEYNRTNIGYELFYDYRDLSDRTDEFDLFFLDYKMPGVNGLDFARMIRDKGGYNKGIIFITAYPEFVYESFEVRTFRFLVKPIRKSKIIEVISSFVEDTRTAQKIVIKVNDESIIVDINDIYFIEADRKYSVVHLKDRDIVCRKTMQAFEDDLTKCDFVRIHRGYLININKISSFDSKNCVMQSGQVLCVSHSKYNDLCHKYLEVRI